MSAKPSEAMAEAANFLKTRTLVHSGELSDWLERKNFHASPRRAAMLLRDIGWTPRKVRSGKTIYHRRDFAPSLDGDEFRQLAEAAGKARERADASRRALAEATAENRAAITAEADALASLQIFTECAIAALGGRK